VTERQVKDMMREVEASQEGINYEEFKKLVLSKSL